MQEAALDFAERILGACVVVEDCSWGHGWSSVLHLRDQESAEWYLKQYRDPQR